MNGFSVFVCDDDPQIRKMLSKQLLSFGLTPTFASDAQSTLSNIAMGSEKFDIAIIDLQLPDLQGDSIVSWLRESEITHVREIPVLFLTGKPDLLTNDYLNKVGNCRVLAKPYARGALGSMLSCLLRRKASTESPLI